MDYITASRKVLTKGRSKIKFTNTLSRGIYGLHFRDVTMAAQGRIIQDFWGKLKAIGKGIQLVSSTTNPTRFSLYNDVHTSIISATPLGGGGGGR